MQPAAAMAKRTPKPRRSKKKTQPAPGAGIVAHLRKSTNPRKKFQVTVVHPNGRKKTVHFGGIREDGERYRDFTTHKDPEIMRQYLARHQAREDWTIGGVDKAGFWARWLLWSRPTLQDAIALTEQTFGIQIRRSAPPRREP